MEAPNVRRAVAAGVSTATGLGLRADEAVVLHNSNRLAIRLLPCDALARVAPSTHRTSAEFEVEVAQRLAGAGAPIALLEPRVERGVYESDGFAVTLWTYYDPMPAEDVASSEFAGALAQLHAAMRDVDVAAPHYTDRVAEAQSLVADKDRTPGLADADREFLATALRTARRKVEDWNADDQLLHGEPHAGNLLDTNQGLLFIDLETCCRGPVEFDIAHAPERVSEHYAGAGQDLVRDCRVLVLAMITAWRWDRDDQFPNGHRLGIEWLDQLRLAVD